jgi:hypothetical protein
MQNLILVLLVGISALLYQNCSSVHEAWDNQSSSSSLGLTNNPISIAAFEKTLYPILTNSNNCVSCHGATQQPLHSQLNPQFSHDVIISFMLVDLENPAQSRLVTKIKNGHENFPTSLSVDIQNAIQAWGDDFINNGGSFGTPLVLEPKFSSINSLILMPKCLSCHNPKGTKPSVDYSDYSSTINTGGVEPFSGANSSLYKECLSGSMPEAATPLSGAELGAIKTWIDNGALNN